MLGEGEGTIPSGLRQLYTVAIGFDFSYNLFIGGRGGVNSLYPLIDEIHRDRHSEIVLL